MERVSVTVMVCWPGTVGAGTVAVMVWAAPPVLYSVTVTVSAGTATDWPPAVTTVTVGTVMPAVGTETVPVWVTGMLTVIGSVTGPEVSGAGMVPVTV